MDLNRLISYSLRIGVLASAALATSGLIAWTITGSNPLTVASGSKVGIVIVSGLTGNASGLIYLAVAVLIATPVFRVAMSTFYFVRERDQKYVLITLAVLSMLIFALVSGSAG